MMLRNEDPKQPSPAGEIRGIQTNFPGPEFDPLQATADDLRHHLLPPRPDQQRMPKAYDNWHRAMASRPRYAEGAEHQITVVKDAPFRAKPNSATSPSTSRNWSGAVVRSRSFDGLALVQGRWTVPRTPAPADGEIFASSVWVGLDGHEPASRVMPQIGTAGRAYRLPNLGPRYHLDRQVGWWQFWMPDHPKAMWQVEILMPVAIGDRFYGQVQVIDDFTVSFFLKNETENQAYAAHYDARIDYGAPDLKPVERQTAAWVVERPQIPDPRDPTVPIEVPLADYRETMFTDCNAATLADDGAWHEFQLQRAHLIRMIDWRDPTSLSRVISQPTCDGEAALLMTYV